MCRLLRQSATGFGEADDVVRPRCAKGVAVKLVAHVTLPRGLELRL